jgi:uncharacterized membrane-anchored protein
MIRSLSRLQIGVLAAAALQLGVLGYMVADRLWLLKNGREIVLPIIPVDPRDLFRGDYVTLSFPVSRVAGNLADTTQAIQSHKFYVTLDQGADGVWTPSKITATLPANRAANQVVLKAKERYGWGSFMWGQGRSRETINALYGLERYYVAEGTGGKLENLARDKKLELVIAVDAKGNAAIKGMNVEGKRIYDEPLL